MSKVVLLKSFQGLGKVGDVISVKPGYAKNYLVPFGIAVFASSKILERIAAEKDKLHALDEKNVNIANSAVSAFSGIDVMLVKPSFSDGRLYGSVSTKEVSVVLLEKCLSSTNADMIDSGFLKNTIRSENIKISGEVRYTGDYQASVSLYGDVIMPFILKIKSTSDIIEG